MLKAQFQVREMQIIIVGAGIGGLSAALSLSLAGHQVTILESAPALTEIGAGGLGSDILEHSVLPNCFNVRQDRDGELLGRVPFGDFEERFNGPYIVIHRADVHRILHKHALKAGVLLRLSWKVVKYEFEGGSVELAGGERLQANLVVAVDGIYSFARESFLPESSGDIEKTGWAAYRTIAEVDLLKANPATSHLVAEHSCNCWIGDQKCVMTYMVKNSCILNIVLSHRDDVDTQTWMSEQYQAEIQRLYGDWEPSLRALLSIASPEIQNWPVYQVKTLPRWTSKSGKFVLVGDAAHEMAFYLSMGVSMAVEDAEALTESLELREKTNASLGDSMHVFERVRKSRAEAVRDASLHAGNMLQLPKGSEQELRDTALRDDGVSAGPIVSDGFFATRISYGIGDQNIREWCCEYDVIAAINREWYSKSL